MLSFWSGQGKTLAAENDGNFARDTISLSDVVEAGGVELKTILKLHKLLILRIARVV